jgi:hypothetical protein
VGLEDTVEDAIAEEVEQVMVPVRADTAGALVIAAIAPEAQAVLAALSLGGVVLC